MTLWTVARHAPLSRGFSRQEYWSGLPFPPPEDLSDPRIKLTSPALQANSLPDELPGKPEGQGLLAFIQQPNSVKADGFAVLWPLPQCHQMIFIALHPRQV